jgi:hypothetical protein
MILTPARCRELATRLEQRAAELDEFPFDCTNFSRRSCRFPLDKSVRRR